MISLRHKKVILFDFDGTIVNSMDGFADIAAKVMSKFYSVDKKWAHNKYFETSGIPFAEQLEELFPKHQLNSEASSEFETEKKISYFKKPLYADVTKTFDELRSIGIKVAISSNNFQELVEAYLNQSGLNTDLIMGYKEGFSKGVDHFKFARNVLNLGFNEMLFVGDSIKDGQRSLGAGIDFVGKAGIFSRERFLTCFPNIMVIERIEELLQLL